LLSAFIFSLFSRRLSPTSASVLSSSSPSQCLANTIIYISPPPLAAFSGPSQDMTAANPPRPVPDSVLSKLICVPATSCAILQD
ncbi:hypothetical protein DFH07DRAFT_810826, partial [Mycena maculata]